MRSETKLGERQPALITSLDEAYKTFVDAVSGLAYVREVFLDEASKYPVIWTMIENPSVDTSLEDPIYKAEGDILRASRRGILLEVLVVDALEHREDLAEIVPPTAKSMWRRQLCLGFAVRSPLQEAVQHQS